MSNKNYTKYSERAKKECATQETEEQLMLAGFDPVLPEEPEVVEVDQPIVGVVVDCDNLNVRTGPTITSNVMCMAVRGSKVEIDLGKSTDEFYKVCTEIGAEGFCMKKYISIQ